MALTSQELDRIRYECGAPVLRVGSEPYIEFIALFTKVIAPFCIDYGSTSSTAVAAAGQSTITVAANPTVPDPYNAPGFVVGAQVVVDVGPSQEFCVIQAVSGLLLTMTFASTHSGTYPVTLKGAEWIVRDIIVRLDNINNQLANFAPQQAGVAQVDEIQLHASRGKGRDQRSAFDELVAQRMYARDELCSALGMPNMWRTKRSGGSRVELY